MTKSTSKAEGAFRTIREVSDWLGVPTHVLRFWESKFEQIAPVKGAGGRRYYRPDDMKLLGGIKVMLHDQGLTIRAVGQKIDDEGTPPVMELSPELEMPERAPPRTRKVIRDVPASEKATEPASEPEAEEVQPSEGGEVVPFKRDPAEPADGEAETAETAPQDDQSETETSDDPIGDALAQPPVPAKQAKEADPVTSFSRQAPTAETPPATDASAAASPPIPPTQTALRLAKAAKGRSVDRLKLRRLRRRLQALADEIRDDLNQGTLR